MKRKTIFTFLFLFLLTACSGHNAHLLIAGEPTSELIAAYPSILPPSKPLIFQGHLELEVRNTRRAVESILKITEAHDGFMLSINQWTVNEKPTAQVLISIPAYQFENA